MNEVAGRRLGWTAVVQVAGLTTEKWLGLGKGTLIKVSERLWFY